MECDEKKTCLVNCAVGIKELIQDPKKEKLETRLESEDVKRNIREKIIKNYVVKEVVENNMVPKKSESGGAKTKHGIRNMYRLGQNKASDSLVEVAKDVFFRDYLNVALFDGSNDAEIGYVHIPECHIPAAPRIIEPGEAKSIIDQNPPDKDFQVNLDSTQFRRLDWI